MANEIRLSISLRVENGNYRDDFRPGQIQIDQSNPGRGGHVQVVGTAAEEAINFGDVSTEGLLVMRNLDTTNYVIWGPDSDTPGTMEPCGRMEAGEPAVFRMEPGVTLYAQADTASCKVDIRLYED